MQMRIGGNAMAIFLRRAFSSSNILLPRSSFQCRHLSQIICSPNISNHCTPTAPAYGFLRESRRGFAKGKKSKDNDTGNTVEVKNGLFTKVITELQMNRAIGALSEQLSKLRTGRASSGMLDHIIVETDSVKMPLSRMAVVSVMDSKTLSINPYDPNALKALENAIVSSPLGLNPKADDQRLIAVIPPLTKDHIQAVCMEVAKSSEEAKQSIRRAQQKALDAVKEDGSLYPEDSAKKMEKVIDELTKEYVKSAEDMCKAKEKEITAG